MADLISIIIPAYNAEATIEACLISLCRQTYSNIEMIVIDDGSKDQTEERARALAEEDHRIIYQKQPNQGVAAARNLGLELAKGRYIGFVDADDQVKAGYIQTLLDHMVQSGVELSVCGYEELQGATVIGCTQGTPRELEQQSAMLELLREDSYRGYVWNKLFLKDLIQTHHLKFDSGIGLWEDVLFVFTYLVHTKKTYYDPVPMYQYRYLETSASHNQNHIIGPEKSYEAIKVQTMLEAIIPTGYTAVQLQLQIRKVLSALSVIRDVGYHNAGITNVYYQKSRAIVMQYGKLVKGQVSRKERILIQLTRFAPRLLLGLYKNKAQ